VTARYIFRRLLHVVPAVAAILVVTFLVIHLAPGDPVIAIAGEDGDQAYYDLMRSKYGLDRSLPAQFFTYVGNVAQGDLGVSYVQGRSVAGLIAERLPATLLLMVSALTLSTLAGIGLGALAARRPFGSFDLAVTSTALVSYAVPTFWLAQLAILVVAYRTGFFPLAGMTDVREQYTGLAHLLDVARHLVLPALVLAASEVALMARSTRTGLIQESGKDYVTVARAKGLSSRRVLFRHALPNALLPVVTIIGTRVGFLFSGAVIVETVFAWPGMGSLIVGAAEDIDHPVLLGLVLLVALTVVFANLLTDLVYAWIDPRIRYQ
jgi:peptide/nickel transport system permease protein